VSKPSSGVTSHFTILALPPAGNPGMS
jgi:hypothetical protein